MNNYHQVEPFSDEWYENKERWLARVRALLAKELDDEYQEAVA